MNIFEGSWKYYFHIKAFLRNDTPTFPLLLGQQERHTWRWLFGLSQRLLASGSTDSIVELPGKCKLNYTRTRSLHGKILTQNFWVLSTLSIGTLTYSTSCTLFKTVLALTTKKTGKNSNEIKDSNKIKWNLIHLPDRIGILSQLLDFLHSMRGPDRFFPYSRRPDVYHHFNMQFQYAIWSFCNLSWAESHSRQSVKHVLHFGIRVFAVITSLKGACISVA